MLDILDLYSIVTFEQLVELTFFLDCLSSLNK